MGSCLKAGLVQQHKLSRCLSHITKSKGILTAPIKSCECEIYLISYNNGI